MPTDLDVPTLRAFLTAQARLFEAHGLAFESRLVDVAGIGKAHVIVTGDGPPVLMVIGGGIPAGTWASLMAELDGYTLFAVDLPGQGPSDRVSYSTGTMRRSAVSFLDEVLDALGLERVPVVGQSAGGTWSTWLALDRPERVSAITYIACPATLLGTSAPFPLRLGTIPWVNWLIGRLDPPSERQVERLGKMAGEDLGGKPELRDLILEYERLPGSSQSLLEMHRSLVRVRGAQPEIRVTAAQLTRLGQPVQFIWGEDDPFGPPEVGQQAVEIMTDAELHVVPGGHAPWFGDPRGVGTLVDRFLAKHTEGARK